MIYAFEGYELDTARREARHGGEVLAVEPQVFDVLAYLIEHRDRVVLKGELLDNIWGDRFVSESALTSRIKSARRLIGDDGSRQRLIRTMHGRGYRFIASIAGPPAADSTQRLAVLDQPVSVGTGQITVGRGPELGHLRRRVAAARQGERHVVFIAGTAGIGKTTLVERLLAELSADDAAIGVGQCVEHRGGAEAYLPVFEAIQQICVSPSGASVVEHLVERAPTWVLQMPGLVASARASKLQRSAVGGSPDRMLREMLDALHAAAQKTFIMLLLEDLHWSDDSTLDLLEAIAMDRRPCRLLVIATHRAGDPATRTRTVQALSVGLRLRARADLVTLDVLTADEVGQLLAARLGGSAPADVAGLLCSRTGGNPLFVERLLDSWLADGLLIPVPDGAQMTADLETVAAHIPDSVRHLIEHTFEGLGPDDQDLLSAASVAGREFSSAEVAAATLRTDDDVESRLADLGRREVFVRPRGEQEWPDHTVTARFAFEHDLHREVLSERIGPSRAAGLHLAIGERLERAFGDDASTAAALAGHYVAAADAARAVRYSTLAADHQLRRSAHREAIEHLRCAADMLARLPPTRARSDEQLRLQITLGNALSTAKGAAAPETAAAYAEVRRLCDDLGDGPHFLPVLYGLWNNAFSSGQHPVACELASAFLHLAERLDDDAVVVARRAVGWPLVFMGRPNEARQHLELIPAVIEPPLTAALIANYREDPAATGRAALSWALWLTGDDTAAQQASHESLQRADSTDHPLTRAYTHLVAAILGQLRNDPTGAEHHGTLALEVSQRHAIPVFESLATIPLGWARARAGDHHAIDLVREGMTAAAATGAGIFQPLALATLGELLTARGEVDAALGILDDAMTIAETSGGIFYTPEIERLRSEALLQSGDHTTAAASAERAIERANALAETPFAHRAAGTLTNIRNTTEPPRRA